MFGSIKQLMKNNYLTFLILISVNVAKCAALGEYDQQLLDAIPDGNINLVLSALKHKANINLGNATSLTPLHYAVIYNQPIIVKILIDAKADLEARNPNITSRSHLKATKTSAFYTNLTPLHYACVQKNLELVKLLVEEKSDINSLCDSTYRGVGHPALYLAADYGAHEVVKYLLSLNCTRGDESEILLNAVKKGHAKTARELLKAKFEQHSYLLLEAVSSNNIDMVKLILTTNCYINYRSLFNNQTALDAAVKINNPEIVEALLKAKANVNNYYDETYKRTPFFFAQNESLGNNNRKQIIKLLIKNGADIRLNNYNLIFENIQTILGINIQEGDLISAQLDVESSAFFPGYEKFDNILKNIGYLIDSFRILRELTPFFSTPLLNIIILYLFTYDELAALRMLHYTDNSGMTALMYAITRQTAKPLKTLFAFNQAHGYIDFSQANKEGETPLALAQKTENNEILAMFNQYAEQLIDLLAQKMMPRPIASIVACYILGEINLSQPIQQQSRCSIQ